MQTHGRVSVCARGTLFTALCSTSVPSWADRVLSSLHWTQEHWYKLEFSLVGEDSCGQVAGADAGKLRGIGVSRGRWELREA